MPNIFVKKKNTNNIVNKKWGYRNLDTENKSIIRIPWTLG